MLRKRRPGALKSTAIVGEQIIAEQKRLLTPDAFDQPLDLSQDDGDDDSSVGPTPGVPVAAQGQTTLEASSKGAKRKADEVGESSEKTQEKKAAKTVHMVSKTVRVNIQKLQDTTLKHHFYCKAPKTEWDFLDNVLDVVKGIQDAGLRKQYLKKFISLVNSFENNKDVNKEIVECLANLKACANSKAIQYLKGIQPTFHSPICKTLQLIELDAEGQDRMAAFLIAISKFKLNTEDTNKKAIEAMKAVADHVRWPGPSVEEFDNSDNQSEAMYEVTYESAEEVESVPESGVEAEKGEEEFTSSEKNHATAPEDERPAPVEKTVEALANTAKEPVSEKSVQDEAPTETPAPVETTVVAEESTADDLNPEPNSEKDLQTATPSIAAMERDIEKIDQESADIEEQLRTLGIETDEEKGTPKKGKNEKSTKNKRQRETESEKGDNRGSPDSQNSKKKRNKKRKTQKRGGKNN